MTAARNQNSSRPDPPKPIRIIQRDNKGNKHSSTFHSSSRTPRVRWKQLHRSQKYTRKDFLPCQGVSSFLLQRWQTTILPCAHAKRDTIPFNCACAQTTPWTDAIGAVEYLFFWPQNSIQYLWSRRDLVTNILYNGQCRAWRSNFWGISFAVVI